MAEKVDISRKIKDFAYTLGFDACGIAPVQFLEKEAHRLEKWLNEGKHGQMSYMENHFDMRVDPGKLVPGAKSVISLLLNYHNPQKQVEGAPKISQYAYGKDYHFVIKEKMRHLHDFIRESFGKVEGRGFVDSAPVLDKTWAQKAGLGWMGKHSNLITKQAGSYFFLAELIVDIELEYDNEFRTDHCGTCTKCLDACPTDAIVEPYVVDGSKCISYLTIELKDEIPAKFSDKMDDWMFGCDVCQEVCPWNRFSSPHRTEAFNVHPDLLSMTRNEWEDLSRETFNEIFKKSAVKRTKYQGLIRNIEFVSGKKKEQ